MTRSEWKLRDTKLSRVLTTGSQAVNILCKMVLSWFKMCKHRPRKDTCLFSLYSNIKLCAFFIPSNIFFFFFLLKEKITGPKWIVLLHIGQEMHKWSTFIIFLMTNKKHWFYDLVWFDFVKSCSKYNNYGEYIFMYLFRDVYLRLIMILSFLI